MGPGAPFGAQEGSKAEKGAQKRLFWAPFGLQNGPKMVKKWSRKREENRGSKKEAPGSILDHFGSHFGAQSGQKWLKKQVENRLCSREAFVMIFL